MTQRALHPNTTQFPNVLLDTLLSVLTAPEWKVLSYIVRRTYGWQRERERIPFSQMSDGRMTKDGRKLIDTGTGLSRPTLTRAVFVLHAAGILSAEGERTQARTYWLRLDFDPDAVTPERLEASRAEYDRKLESLQLKLPLGADEASPSRRIARPPVHVETPAVTKTRERSPESRLRLLCIDLENVRKGRISAGSVARRMKLSVERVEAMVSGDVPPSLI